MSFHDFEGRVIVDARVASNSVRHHRKVNTNQLGKAVQQRKKAGLDCAPELLPHISLLG